jgi:hypothetical protein
MKNYTNKQGYILALIISVIYAVILNKNLDFYSLLGGIIGALLVNIVITGIITIFWKFVNFGKIIGVVSIIVCVIAFLGNRNNDNIQNQKIESKQKSLGIIKEKFNSAYEKFNNKLISDDRKNNLNKLITSNEITFGNSKEVSKKLSETDKYYIWIEETNDSLFTDLKKQLDDYKNKLTNDNEKREIENYKMQFQMTEMKAKSNYIHVKSVIFAMENLLTIKNNCKHQIKDGKILFFNNKCLDDWNKGEIEVNKYISDSNINSKN